MLSFSKVPCAIRYSIQLVEPETCERNGCSVVCTELMPFNVGDNQWKFTLTFRLWGKQMVISSSGLFTREAYLEMRSKQQSQDVWRGLQINTQINWLCLFGQERHRPKVKIRTICSPTPVVLGQWTRD